MIPAFFVTPGQLGAKEYLADHRVKYAYAAGAMVGGIASEALVVRMAKARLLSFFGAGGLSLERIEQAILTIRRQLQNGEPWGMNLLCNTSRPEKEWRTVELYVRHGIQLVEASAFMTITPGLVYYRLNGARRLPNGQVVTPHHIHAKVSRPEIARQFLAPPPARLVAALLQDGKLTAGEAELAGHVPMAEDVCVEADSGGHTDKGVAFTLLPAILALRNEATRQHRFVSRPRIGAAGGLGTPHAIAAAFVLGAEFVLTGSINQCTVEAGTSDLVKDMLQQAGVQDTDMAPAGDMFELGAQVQVLKKGSFFSARANRLYDLYTHHDSLEAIDEPIRKQLEAQYFKRPLPDVRRQAMEYVRQTNPPEFERMQGNPKLAMLRVFKSYFARASDAAINGVAAERSNFQIHCGPAMGAFNEWVKETPYREWRTRHVDAIAELLMSGACAVLSGSADRAQRSAADASVTEPEAAYA
jgi:trans-AT polyketide synthase, acyltransferase and oxidoreductase domains